MVLYRLLLSAHGRLDGDRLDTEALDPEIVAPFEPLFADGLSFNAAMPGAPQVTVKWTGSDGGQALLTCSHRGDVFLSGAVVAGLDTEGDAEVLRMFVRSLESIPLLRQITGGRANPLATVLERPDRPLLASVVWPTLPAETFEQVAGLDILLSAVFLRCFGSE
jgi:hypothetical protein